MVSRSPRWNEGAVIPGLLGFSSLCHNLWIQAGFLVCSHGKNYFLCPCCGYHGVVSTQTFKGQGVVKGKENSLEDPSLEDPNDF